MDRRNFLIRSSAFMLGSAFLNPFGIYMGNTSSISNSSTDKTAPLTLFLAGDVMSGRGIDQVLPHSVDPQLYERFVKNANRYVQLAGRENGSIPDEVSYSYIWGEALEVLNQYSLDIRIINLETAVTTSDDYEEGKAVHYRMHPKNTALLTEADIDICVLGNNHMQDWGSEGLEETLSSLQQANLKTVGAGSDMEPAAEPAVLEDGNGRLLVFSYSSPSAGVPMSWSTGAHRMKAKWVRDILDRECDQFGHSVEESSEGHLELRWQ